jgi:hypothetical protein
LARFVYTASPVASTTTFYLINIYIITLQPLTNAP